MNEGENFTQLVEDYPQVFGMIIDVLVEGLALDKLHDHEPGPVVGPAVVEYLGQAGMVETAEDSEFVLETSHGFFVGGVLGVQTLCDLHGSIVEVTNLLHDGGSTTTDGVEYLVSIAEKFHGPMIACAPRSKLRQADWQRPGMLNKSAAEPLTYRINCLVYVMKLPFIIPTRLQRTLLLYHPPATRRE
jgi:hypothetical protein